MSPLPRSRLLAYGGLGLPLAFAALPLYVHLAPFYSGVISLSVLGAILLALRFLDAAIDPLIGTLFDRFPHPRSLIALSLPVLGMGWIGVFTLPASLPVVPWLIGMLTLTTVGYSLATVVHTSWGARLSNVPHERTRLFAAREGCGLLGVVLAAALPTVLAPTLAEGLARMGWIFFGLLLVFATLTLVATPPMQRSARSPGLRHMLRPLANPAFARFVPGYLLNGVAAALPATLVIFFIDDVLQLASHSGLFLVIYFLSGALGLPLWVRLAKRIGTLDAWLLSMGLSIAAFSGAFWLGAGDLVGYALVCAASGLALGADLALPPALVADMIDADAQPQPGAYYGLMSFFAKLTLALAAGLALPLLDLWGYAPGGDQLFALSATYALLPIAMKLGALAWFWRARQITPSGVVPC
ncbi:MAG: MFS transporter [Thiobacillus sp.]|nr:MFS transporter [Thiobacillus sp.]